MLFLQHIYSLYSWLFSCLFYSVIELGYQRNGMEKNNLLGFLVSGYYRNNLLGNGDVNVNSYVSRSCLIYIIEYKSNILKQRNVLNNLKCKEQFHSSVGFITAQ